jgi:hypothetical protein
MEGTPLKALYALVFVLFSFAAPAQTLETWIAAYYFDDLDCSGKTTQQSTVSTQMIAIELLCATLDEVNVAIARPHAPSDDKLTVDDTIEPGAVPAQIIAVEPTIEKLGEATLNRDDVAITGPNDAEDIVVGAIQPNAENATVKYSSGSDGKLMVDYPIKQTAMPSQIIATEPTVEKPGEARRSDADDLLITGPNDAKDVPY